MDIKKRINARKIVLSYFYQHCFFSALAQNQVARSGVSPEAVPLEEERKEKSDFLDADFLQSFAKKKLMREQRDQIVQEKINTYAEHYAIEDDFDYLLRYFFDQWSPEDVDIDYVLKVGNALPHYEQELIEKANRYAQSFSYDQMDLVDQVLLLLGYIEHQVLQTPKELILNEMVELAKRYWDHGSPKLLNGLLHAIFENKEQL